MIYNVSKGKDNYSQRNNKIKPLESCNVTSMIMALSYIGYEPLFPVGNYEQPEDNLRYFIENSSICIQEYKNYVSRNSWASGIPAVQIHQLLSDFTNLWIGQKVTHFSERAVISTIFSELRIGRPVVISGDFPRTGKTNLGHIVTLVGYNSMNNDVIYDDPYGKTYIWDGVQSGNDVTVPFDLFVRDIKPGGNSVYKMAHFFLEKSRI
jgi:hypothetical protein